MSDPDAPAVREPLDLDAVEDELNAIEAALAQLDGTPDPSRAA